MRWHFKNLLSTTTRGILFSCPMNTVYGIFFNLKPTNFKADTDTRFLFKVYCHRTKVYHRTHTISNVE